MVIGIGSIIWGLGAFLCFAHLVVGAVFEGFGIGTIILGLSWLTVFILCSWFGFDKIVKVKRE